MDAPKQSSACLPVILWFFVSIVVGSIGSSIPWGSENRLHGTGFPIPIVMWDKPPGRDQFVDYISFGGLILNPVIVFLAGLFLWAIWSAARWVVRRLRA